MVNVPSWARLQFEDSNPSFWNEGSLEGFFFAYDKVSAHIDGMEQDRESLVQSLFKENISGSAAAKIGKVIAAAPNFQNYKWPEFEQWFSELGVKEATRSKCLSEEIGVTITSLQSSYRDLTRVTNPDMAKRRPYVLMSFSDSRARSQAIIAALGFEPKTVMVQGDRRLTLDNIPITPEFLAPSFFALNDRDLAREGLTPLDPELPGGNGAVTPQKATPRER